MRTAILGIPHFSDLDKVVDDTIKICKVKIKRKKPFVEIFFFRLLMQIHEVSFLALQ